MSWEATAYVAGLDCGKDVKGRGEKLVLLLLANNYNNHKGEAWPSQKLLAEESGFSIRGLKYILARLEKKELIERRVGDGRGHKTAYRFPGFVLKGAAAAPFSTERVQNRLDKGCKNEGTKGAKLSAQRRNVIEPIVSEPKERTFARAVAKTSPEATAAWSKLEAALKGAINILHWKTWIRPCGPAGADGGYLMVGTPNAEFVTWNSDHFMPQIEAAASRLGLEYSGVRFCLRSELADAGMG